MGIFVQFLALLVATTLSIPACAQQRASQTPRPTNPWQSVEPAKVGPLEIRVENVQLNIGRQDPVLVIRLSIYNSGSDNLGVAVSPGRSNVIADTNDVFDIPRYHGIGVSGIHACLEAGDLKRCETNTIPAGSRVIALIRPQPENKQSVSLAQISSVSLVFVFAIRNTNEVATQTISFSDVPVQRRQAQ